MGCDTTTTEMVPSTPRPALEPEVRLIRSLSDSILGCLLLKSYYSLGLIKEWITRPVQPSKNKIYIKLTQTNNQGTLQSKKPTMALERPLQSGTGTLDKARGGSGERCNSFSHLAFHLLGMKTLHPHYVIC